MMSLIVHLNHVFGNLFVGIGLQGCVAVINRWCNCFDLFFELLFLSEQGLREFVPLHVLDRLDIPVFLGVHIYSDLGAVLLLQFGHLPDHKTRGVIIASCGKGGILFETGG